MPCLSERWSGDEAETVAALHSIGLKNVIIRPQVLALESIITAPGAAPDR